MVHDAPEGRVDAMVCSMLLGTSYLMKHTEEGTKWREAGDSGAFQECIGTGLRKDPKLLA
jgi:hypothetical protein